MMNISTAESTPINVDNEGRMYIHEVEASDYVKVHNIHDDIHNLVHITISGLPHALRLTVTVVVTVVEIPAVVRRDVNSGIAAKEKMKCYQICTHMNVVLC